MRRPDDSLWSAFTNGIEDAGVLVLPTGRIVVSDPFVDFSDPALSIAVEPGTYPIFVSRVDRDIGVVLVMFAEQTPIRWRKPKPSTFSNDSATGCLLDNRASRFLRRKAAAGKLERHYFNFENALTERGGNCGSHCLDSRSGTNAFLFRTFGGDGTFPMFFGYGEKGGPVCLAVDLCEHSQQELSTSD
jgi:hypothetical protein